MLPMNITRDSLSHTEKQGLSNTDKNEGFKTKAAHMKLASSLFLIRKVVLPQL